MADNNKHTNSSMTDNDTVQTLKMQDKVAAAVAEEANSSDRSSQGSGGGAPEGYSADCSGSASDEEEDEGPSCGSGSDDSNNGKKKQMSEDASASGGAFSGLANCNGDINMANSWPVSAKSLTSEEACSPRRKSLGRNGRSSSWKVVDLSGDAGQRESDDSSNRTRNEDAQAKNVLAVTATTTTTTTSNTTTTSSTTKVQQDRRDSSRINMASNKNTTNDSSSSTTSSSSSTTSSNSSSSSSGSLTGGAPPQVRRPMDPRIDLSVVQTAKSFHDDTHEADGKSNRIMYQDMYDLSTTNHNIKNNSNSTHPFMVAGHMTTSTHDNYQRLMEVSERVE